MFTVQILTCECCAFIVTIFLWTNCPHVHYVPPCTFYLYIYMPLSQIFVLLVVKRNPFDMLTARLSFAEVSSVGRSVFLGKLPNVQPPLAEFGSLSDCVRNRFPHTHSLSLSFFLNLHYMTAFWHNSSSSCLKTTVCHIRIQVLRYKYISQWNVKIVSKSDWALQDLLEQLGHINVFSRTAGCKCI